MNCDYRLVLDNLMDLTHETFVHGSSIGNRAVAEAPFVATHGDRSATVTRWMEDIEAPPFWAGADPPCARLRRAWSIAGRSSASRRRAPSRSTSAWRRRAAARSRWAATPGDRSQGVNGYVLNTITPETERSLPLLLGLRRNYCLGEQRLTHELREGVGRIFREDELVLEAQQRAIDERPEHTFYNLNIDAGSMWARRLIDQMIAERAGAQRTFPLRPAA